MAALDPCPPNWQWHLHRTECAANRPREAEQYLFLFLHGLTSGLWSVTEPSPDAPGPRGQGMSICYNRALAAELVSSSLNCVKIRYRGSNPRPLARYCSHKAIRPSEGVPTGRKIAAAVLWSPQPGCTLTAACLPARQIATHLLSLIPCLIPLAHRPAAGEGQEQESSEGSVSARGSLRPATRSIGCRQAQCS